MQVQETVIAEVADEAFDPGWFAARQPGIMKYLEATCGAGTDAYGVGLDAALAIHAAYERTLGVPPPRVQSSLLARAEKAIAVEAHARAGDGLIGRQPAVSEFVAAVVANPPVPLTGDEATRLGLSLLAVAYALDELSSGRPASSQVSMAAADCCLVSQPNNNILMGLYAADGTRGAGGGAGGSGAA